MGAGREGWDDDRAMRTPNVLTRRMILDTSPPPTPLGGTRRRRISPRTFEYRPKVKLVTGRLPTDENSQLEKLVRVGSPEPDTVRRQRRLDRMAGDLLGGLALLLVANLWLSTVLGIIGLVTGTRMPFAGDGAIVIALYGVHLFGIPGAILSDRSLKPGLIAIVAFWISLLGSVPVGFAVMRLVELIAG